MSENEKTTNPADVISCGCIIIKDDKVLLVGAKGDNGKIFWGFPKGHKESGETNIVTALRETKEETGLTVAIADEAPITVSHPTHGGTATKTIHLFLATPTTNEITIQEDEIEAAEWLPFPDAIARTKDYYRTALTEALARLNK